MSEIFFVIFAATNQYYFAMTFKEIFVGKTDNSAIQLARNIIVANQGTTLAAP